MPTPQTLDAQLEVVHDERLRHPECPVWDITRDRLWWVNPPDREIHRMDTRTRKHRAYTLPSRPGALVLASGGGLVLAVDGGFARCADDGTAFEWIVRTGRDQLNDGKCDPRGRFLAGSLVNEQEAPGTGVLYRMERGVVSVVFDGVTISNGLGWSPAGDVLYYIDTPREQIEAFDYDLATGALSGRRVFADLHDVPGRPDGLAVDADGGVWVAMARGGRAVRRFTPDGEPHLVLPVPVAMVTSVAFGGPELGDLFITTSTIRQSDEDLARQPLAGRVLRVRDIGYRGVALATYAA